MGSHNWKPFWGTTLLELSVGRDLGALKAVRSPRHPANVFSQKAVYLYHAARLFVFPPLRGMLS